MRQFLNEPTRLMFDRYFAAAVKGGCDGRQAEAIAKERTLKVVMATSAAVHEQRERIGSNVVREEPAPRYRFD